jgi:methyl-accepting chemotaxis protein
MEEMAQAIAGAVEQQNAATGEITQNIAQTTQGTQEVTRLAEDVQGTADRTSEAAMSVTKAAGGLLQDIKALSEESSAFVSKISVMN